MKIASTYQSTGLPSSVTSTSDSISRNYKAQIKEVQQKIQELNSNKSISPEEKKQQLEELNQQLNDLNQQLRQHELDKQKEQQEKIAQKQKEQLQKQKSQKEQTSSTGFQKDTIQAMAAAETSQAVVREKEGVRMDLSHDAMSLSNAIKREELDGGVSSLRSSLNELYGEIGALTGEIVGELQNSAKALDDAASKRPEKQTSHSEETEEEEPTVETEKSQES